MMRPFIFAGMLLVFTLQFGLYSGLNADETTEAAPAEKAADPILLITKRIAEIDASGLDEASKAKAKELYGEARQEADLLATWTQQFQLFEARQKNAVRRLTEMQQLELTAQAAQPLLDPPANSDLTELETTLAERQAELARIAELVKQLDDEPQRRAARRAEIPKNIATLREQTQEVEKHLAEAGDPQEIVAIAQARRLLLETRLSARRMQSAALEAELAAYDAEKDLPSREENYNRNLQSQLSHSVERLTNIVNERRHDVVSRRHAEVERQVRQAPAVLEAEAKRNYKQSLEARDLTEKLASAGNELAVLKRELGEWQQRLARTKRRVEKGSRESAVMSLRKDRGAASGKLTDLRRDLKSRVQQVLEVQIHLVDLQDRNDEYADIDAQLVRLRTQRGFDKSPEEEQALTAAARRMLTTHKELLDDLTIRTTQYFDLLVELNDVTQEFVTELRSYLEYIDERILWLRSADPISGLTLHDAWAAVMDLGQTHHWQRIGLGLWNDAFDQPVITLGFLIVFGALTVYRRALRCRVAQLGEVAARGNCVQYLPTFRALLLTMVISGTWALALAYVGWRLIEVALTPGAQLILFWGTSLVGAALVYFPLECLRQVCRRKGLGECHFQWSTRNTHLLRMHLRWYVPLATLLVTLCYGMQVHRNDTWNTALGRIAFVALMLMTTTFLQRIVRPKGGLFQEYLAYHADGWFGRLKWIWYPALVLAPTATAFLAAVGYYYTAWQLSLRVFHTALVILVAVLGGALLYRRLFISRRKLAMRQARQRQQRMQEQAVAEETGRPAPPDISFDLAELNLQTRRLIHGSLVLAAITATWFIWSDMLPALAVLESVTLYRTESVAGVLQSVTLADMGVALIALIMTWTAARNLPGVIEIALLQRLPLESSVRYAITTLARYLIAIFGVIVISSTLGFSWRRAQWLVAALGVGLGFGLQEIFGNFVSGLILLFERPIRVGDVITLGEVSGMVKRIRIRATTVRDWDGKELIVPNKDLITGRLLNWTLSDTENRIVITVGVGYGSDIHRAQEIMLEVADQHPELSKQPPPRVTFESFDPSSLRLVLRAFLPKLDTRTDCVNDLHTAIYDRFREEGIELAFPQIDVHVRDFAPLPVQDGQITVRDRSARSA